MIFILRLSLFSKDNSRIRIMFITSCISHKVFPTCRIRKWRDDLLNLFFYVWKPPRALIPTEFTVEQYVGIEPTKTARCSTLRLGWEGSGNRFITTSRPLPGPFKPLGIISFQSAPYI